MRIVLSSLVLAAAVTAANAALISPASAQSLNQWGMWGDRPQKWRPPPKGQVPDSWNSRQRRIERFEDRYGRRYEPDWDPWSDEPRRQRPSGPAVASGGGQPYIDPVEPPTVSYPGSEAEGTIVIDSSARKLYFTLGNGAAYAYPISVGRQGFEWTGTETISRVAEWPDWHPPKEMRERDPKLPEKMTGGIKNPLGAVALYLGNTLYRIHGTNDRKSIGQAASSGCFRMLNEHALHLASVAGVGTPVKVLPHLPPPPEITAEAPLPEQVMPEDLPPLAEAEPGSDQDPFFGPADEPPMQTLPRLREPGVERLEIGYRP